MSEAQIIGGSGLCLGTSEVWPVGRHDVLFSATTGAVALANETAVAIWRMLWRHADPILVENEVRSSWQLAPDEARTLVGKLISSWNAAGLLGAPTAGAPRRASGCLPPLRSGPISTYATQFGRFDLGCEDAYAGAVMSAVLVPLAACSATQEQGRKRSASVELRGTTDAYWVTRDGMALCEPGNIALARHQVLRQLIIDPGAPERTSAVLHAAAVTVGGRGVVIAGDCGRGKSTLTACLVYRGAGYVADDLIPLESNGLWVGTYPVALSVKSGSWPIVGPLFPPRLWSRENVINDFRLQYVDLRHCAERRPRVGVSLLTFPHYTAGAPFSAEAVAPEQALQMLMVSGSRPAGTPPSIEGLCRLADRTPAYKLTYGNWRDAARFIEAEVARAG